MKARYLRLTTTLLLALAVPSLVLAEEVANKAETSAAEAPVAPCATGSPLRTAWRPEPTCVSRVWAWLTYQPLNQPNKCCKLSAMPCCPPRNYWFFPCVDAHGQCPMSGYTAKSCGCQH
jgi:hypothetical protein